MFDERYSELVAGFVSALTGSFVTWFFSRKKQRVEVKVSELDLTEKAVSIWRELSEDLKKRVETLEVDRDRLKSENIELRAALKRVERDNTNLKKRLSKYEEKDQDHTTPQ